MQAKGIVKKLSAVSHQLSAVTLGTTNYPACTLVVNSAVTDRTVCDPIAIAQFPLVLEFHSEAAHEPEPPLKADS